jgi:hypothetical protein
MTSLDLKGTPHRRFHNPHYQNTFVFDNDYPASLPDTPVAEWIWTVCWLRGAKPESAGYFAFRLVMI